MTALSHLGQVTCPLILIFPSVKEEPLWDGILGHHMCLLTGVEGIVSTVCGKPKVIGKVYGGHNAVTGQWPWQASLLFRGQHLCGAVLIDAHWLLSTAHCFLK